MVKPNLKGSVVLLRFRDGSIFYIKKRKIPDLTYLSVHPIDSVNIFGLTVLYCSTKSLNKINYTLFNIQYNTVKPNLKGPVVLHCFRAVPPENRSCDFWRFLAFFGNFFHFDNFLHFLAIFNVFVQLFTVFFSAHHRDRLFFYFTKKKKKK